MKEKIKIKHLKIQLNKLEGEKQALKIKLKNSHKEYELKKNAVLDLQSKIEAFDHKNEIEVSDHAIVRYFERVKGYDIEAVKNDILPADILELIRKLGANGSYPNKNFKIVLREYTVVTILKK